MKVLHFGVHVRDLFDLQGILAVRQRMMTPVFDGDGWEHWGHPCADGVLHGVLELSNIPEIQSRRTQRFIEAVGHLLVQLDGYTDGTKLVISDRDDWEMDQENLRA